MSRDPTETQRIRVAVFHRSNGWCECGCGDRLPFEWEMDHFFGRAKVEQSKENCWALTGACHYSKTRNYPSGITWAKRFETHAKKHGYQLEEAMAATRAFTLHAKGFHQ